MAIATAFLSLFTLGMAFVIFFQLRATQHSERAWMIGSPEFNKFTRAPANNEVIVYPASYKNVGKSPARLLEAAVSLKMVEKLEPAVFTIEAVFVHGCLYRSFESCATQGQTLSVFSNLDLMSHVADDEISVVAANGCAKAVTA